MFGSLVVYAGLVLALAGAVARRFRLALAALLLVPIGLLLPAPESRIRKVASRLDELVPVWQFHEVHTRHIAAPPERVYDAIRKVRADEISLFSTLTWIRRGGRDLPPGVLNAGGQRSLIDVATSTSFIRLVDDAPRELVIGTIINAPHGVSRTATEATFRNPVVKGVTLAAMNFIVKPDGAGGSLVSTETRVFANSPHKRRRFAMYWRAIYPGSAIIRRMWLRAIEKRAVGIEPAAS